MGKTLSNPDGKRFIGSVELHDPLTYPQYMAWSEAITAASPHRKTNYLLYCATLLPGVCICVQKWDLTDKVTGLHLGTLTPETFPASPRSSADKLLGWLVAGIGSLVEEADEVDPK